MYWEIRESDKVEERERRNEKAKELLVTFINSSYIIKYQAIMPHFYTPSIYPYSSSNIIPVTAE